MVFLRQALQIQWAHPWMCVRDRCAEKAVVDSGQKCNCKWQHPCSYMSLSRWQTAHSMPCPDIETQNLTMYLSKQVSSVNMGKNLGEQKRITRVILVSLIDSNIGTIRIELLSSLTTKKRKRRKFFPASEEAWQKERRSLFKSTGREQWYLISGRSNTAAAFWEEQWGATKLWWL